jgi:hypothetical protein
MAMPPHSRFACSPSEVAKRIAVDCGCWLFTPCQRWNRMKHGKSRLITMKTNIDRSASTCRPQSATFYSLIIARNIDRRLRSRIQCSIGKHWVERAIQFQNGRAFSLSCFLAIGESRAVARRYDMQDRLALFSIAGFFRPAHSAATCRSRSSQPSA